MLFLKKGFHNGASKFFVRTVARSDINFSNFEGGSSYGSLIELSETCGYPHLLKSRSLEGVPVSSGKSQKEGQEDQGIPKQLGGGPS